MVPAVANKNRCYWPPIMIYVLLTRRQKVGGMILHEGWMALDWQDANST
jgi:hypothetical protein